MSFGVIVYACQVSYLARGHAGDNGDSTHVVGRLPAGFSLSFTPSYLFDGFFFFVLHSHTVYAHATKKRLRSNAATKGNKALSATSLYGFIPRNYYYSNKVKGNNKAPPLRLDIFVPQCNLKSIKCRNYAIGFINIFCI